MKHLAVVFIFLCSVTFCYAWALRAGFVPPPPLDPVATLAGGFTGCALILAAWVLLVALDKVTTRWSAGGVTPEDGGLMRLLKDPGLSGALFRIVLSCVAACGGIEMAMGAIVWMGAISYVHHRFSQAAFDSICYETWQAARKGRE